MNENSGIRNRGNALGMKAAKKGKKSNMESSLLFFRIVGKIVFS